MRVMLSQATRDKLEQIKEIAPELSLEAIVERAFITLHEALERKRRAKLKRPKVAAKADDDAVTSHQCEAADTSEEPALSEFPETTGPKTHTRYIDAETRRFVLRRDNYECQFVGENGRKCCSKRYIQFHHRDPFAKGGPTIAANLALFCKSHNLYQAELDFGLRDEPRAA